MTGERIDAAALMRALTDDRLHLARRVVVQNFGNVATAGADECVSIVRDDGGPAGARNDGEPGAIDIDIHINETSFELPPQEQRMLAFVPPPAGSLATRGVCICVFVESLLDDRDAMDYTANQLRQLLGGLKAFATTNTKVTIDFGALDMTQTGFATGAAGTSRHRSPISTVSAAARFVFRAATLGLRGYNLIPPDDLTMRTFFYALLNAYTEAQPLMRSVFVLSGRRRA